MLGSVARSVVSLIADLGIVNLIPAWHHTFVENYYEIFSTCTIILLLLLIQKGLLSITDLSKYTELSLSLPRKKVCLG